MKNKLSLTLTILLSAVLLASCDSNKSGQPSFPPVPVTSYTVKSEMASYYNEYPATVIALNQVEIRPEVSGYLTDIYFKDGQHVGDPSPLIAPSLWGWGDGGLTTPSGMRS